MDKAARVGIRIADLLDKERIFEKDYVSILKKKSSICYKMFDDEPIAFENF